MNKVLEALVQALKEAAASAEPLPLYRSGKQPGLFSARTGVAAEAARKAMDDGLLEPVRVEANARPDAEFVRVSPRGVQFLYQHESPKSVLEELLTAMKAGADGLPRWQEELKAQLHALVNRFQQLLEKQSSQFAHLMRRGEEALRRLQSPPTDLPLEAWQLDAINYLNQRRAVGRADSCTLQELFHALGAESGTEAFTLARFHDGLVHLRDRGVLELVPAAGSVAELAEPEYALMDGAAVFAAVRPR